MKNRDIANLLNRAAAALETPRDLTKQDKAALIEDLTEAAKHWQEQVRLSEEIVAEMIAEEKNPPKLLSIGDKAALFDRIQNEGSFEYALLYYSDWTSIENEEFHRLRADYRDAKGPAKGARARAKLVVFMHQYDVEEFQK